MEPFDGSNYTLWSYKMKMYLMSKGLWEAVEGKAEATSSKEQQAHAAIVLNLNDSQLMHVVTAKSAKEAWEKLEKFHRAQDVANRLWLKEKFSSFKYTTSSVSKHVTELEQLVLEMKSAGCEPSDEDVCATLLRSLPASYESLVQAFRMSMTELKLADLVGKLIAEEVRQKDSTRIEEATALLANKGNAKATKKKQQASKSGYKYIVTFIMMKSRYVTIYPLRMKSEVPDAFAKFLKEIKVTAGLTVKILRSDNGGEYRNAIMDALCDAKTIKQEFTVPYNPQQNVMSERMNRTLMEMTRCMLKESGLDKIYWCKAIMTATDIRNVLPNTSNPHVSPFEMVFKWKSRLDHMRVFGSECYAHVTKEKRKKLDDSGVKCYFLGYAKQSKAYRLLNASDGSIVVSMSVTFADHSSDKVATKKGDVIDIIDEDDDKDTQDEQDVDGGFRTPTMEPQQEPQQSEHAGPTHAVPTRGSSTPGRDGQEGWMVRPERKRRGVVRYQDEYTGAQRGHFNLDDFEAEWDSLYCLHAEDDGGEHAVSYEEVMRSKYKDQWLDAMKSEMKSLEDHNR
uniref:Integrase catalytic domain-containing protein n=1 Tax=Phytophthora ramorum TaxID=164328 RepID=H3H953_PHYRM